MIHFSRHPTRLRLIGYWIRPGELGYPDPTNFVDPTWSPLERANVIEYLTSGVPFIQYCGFSWCRFKCGMDLLGTKELSDGEYYWPEGLAHYLERHDVKLPIKFLGQVRKRRHIDVDKVRKRIGHEPGTIDTPLDREALETRSLMRDHRIDKSGNTMVLRVGERENFWISLDESWWKRYVELKPPRVDGRKGRGYDTCEIPERRTP